jgi:hypothetical protein
MLLRQPLRAAFLSLLFASAFATAAAQPPAPQPGERVGRAAAAPASGLITDRLTARELKRWRAIERLVLAVDAQGQPLRPTLRGLWEWAATSGHAIHIELPSLDRTRTSLAGSFNLEQADPHGKRHRAVIRLCLANIDQAHVGPQAARADGLIPFQGLSREERYAEVLGHELAHAADILSSPARAQMVEEQVEQTNALLLSHNSRYRAQQFGPELQQRLSHRDSLLKELEARAEAVEAVIWRELVAR